MTEARTLRPGLATILAALLLALPAYLILDPLCERLTDALDRKAARQAQLDFARDALTQRIPLERQTARIERDLDEGSLFHRGPDLPSVQGTLQSSVRAAVQNSDATIRMLDMKSEPSSGTRRRMTIKVTAEGSLESLYTALSQLEAARPRLLLRTLHLHTSSSGMLTLDVDIDAYADLSAS